jgi:hypothetical protein
MNVLVKTSQAVVAALDLEDEDREEALKERINDIADWFNRVKKQREEYHLPEVTINTLMSCVGDLITIARFYRKTER